MSRVDDYGHYDGSRVFSPLAEALGLSVDQVISIKLSKNYLKFQLNQVFLR